MSKLSWNHLGLCLNALGRPMEAIHAHKRALELDPGFREALANIGQAYKDYGNSRTHLPGLLLLLVAFSRRVWDAGVDPLLFSESREVLCEGTQGGPQLHARLPFAWPRSMRRR